MGSRIVAVVPFVPFGCEIVGILFNNLFVYFCLGEKKTTSALRRTTRRDVSDKKNLKKIGMKKTRVKEKIK